jgi:hypothetical protein
VRLVHQLQPWAVVRALRKRAHAVYHAARSAPPARPGVGGALDQLDDEFHAAYERSRTEVADDEPVFVVLANDLVLLHHGQRRAWSFSPRAYHLLKEVAHVPLALFATLGDEPSEHALGRTPALLTWIEAAQADVATQELEEDTRRDMQRVLELSACALREQRLTPGGLRDLARDTGPILRRMIDRATELQLDALHEHVEAALASLTSAQIARLQVVVTGNHQARARSLPMQYFRARLREPEGEEHRVTYAEAVSSEQEALALLGTKAIDRAIALAFFGDPTRMQRDLLGDAAHALMAKRAFQPIELT